MTNEVYFSVTQNDIQLFCVVLNQNDGTRTNMKIVMDQYVTPPPNEKYT